MTRSSSLPRKRQGNTRTMLCSYQTVPKEDCTSRSNATPPLATAGVCWWTPDGPYLGPPRGGRDFSYRKLMCFVAILRGIYGTFTLIYKDSWNLLLDSFWQTNQTVVTQSRCDHGHHNTAEWSVDRKAVQLDDPASCPLLANICNPADFIEAPLFGRNCWNYNNFQTTKRSFSENAHKSDTSRQTDISIAEDTELLGGLVSGRSEVSQAGRAGHWYSLVEQQGWVSD